MSRLYSILTVITPAESQLLCTLEAVKLELNIAEGDTSSDDLINDRIRGASSTIARYCDRVFGLETVEEGFRSVCGQDGLKLRRSPITAVTSVAVDGTTLDPADYEIDAEDGRIWRLASDQRTGWAGAKITIRYSGGYLLPDDPSPTLPADVESAAILLVSARYNSRGRDPMLRSESAQDVGQVSYLDPRSGMESMPPQAAALLAPYREFGV